MFQIIFEATFVVVVNIFLLAAATIAVCALMAKNDTNNPVSKSIRVVLSLIIITPMVFFLVSSVYRMRCDINGYRLSSDVVAAFNDLKPGDVVKISLGDNEIPLLSDDFSLKCPNECLIYDNAYYFIGKGSDNKSYNIHFSTTNDKSKISKETLKTLLTRQTSEYKRMVDPHSGLSAPVRHRMSPLIPQDELLKLVRHRLKENSESSDEVASNDMALLIYFAIFDDIHSFTILGCEGIEKRKSVTEIKAQEQADGLKE